MAAEQLNVNNFTNGMNLTWFLYNFWLAKTLEGYIKIHGPQPPQIWHIQNLRDIQNPGLFRNLGYSELEAYSEPC